MSTPPNELEYFDLGSFKVPRLWIGLWQLSSTAWGSAPAPKIRGAMKQHIEQGFTAFGRKLVHPPTIVLVTDCCLCADMVCAISLLR
jgi:hypothetical protein